MTNPHIISISGGGVCAGGKAARIHPGFPRSIEKIPILRENRSSTLGLSSMKGIEDRLNGRLVCPPEATNHLDVSLNSLFADYCTPEWHKDRVKTTDEWQTAG
jgi:hypothetical protein